MKSDTVTPGEVSADAAGANEAKTVEGEAAAGDDTAGTTVKESSSAAVDLGKRGSGGTEADRPAEPASSSSETAGSPVRDAPSTSRGAGGIVLTAVLAALVVALTVGMAVLGWQVKQQHDVDAAGRAAQDAAEQYAVLLTSIDSKDLDADFAAVLDGATGAFKDMYGQSSTQLKQLLIDNNATGQGSVIDSAIKSASEDRAEILLFVDQTVTNSAAPEPRIDRSRVLMTMEKVDGRWLAAQVTLP